MTTIYTYDDQAVFVAAIDIDPMGPVPRGTLTPPPATTGTQVAQWSGVSWAVLPDYPEPLPVPEPVPTSCTPAQGLIALYALKSITEADVLTAIASIPDAVQRYTAQVGYSRAITWERESQTMQALAALLNLDDTDLDALFVYAAGVRV